MNIPQDKDQQDYLIKLLREFERVEAIFNSAKSQVADLKKGLRKVLQVDANGLKDFFSLCYNPQYPSQLEERAAEYDIMGKRLESIREQQELSYK